MAIRVIDMKNRRLNRDDVRFELDELRIDENSCRYLRMRRITSTVGG